MALIDDIIKVIKALPIKDGKMTMGKLDFPGLDFMTSFFDQLLKEASLSLDDVKVTPDKQAITIEGKANLFGYTDLSLSIYFDVQDKQVVATVNGIFDRGKTVNLPVIDWVKVGDISLTTSITEKFKIVNFKFLVNILTENGSKIPVYIDFIPNNEWNLKIAGDNTQGISTTALVSLIGGHDLTSFIPADLVAKLDQLILNGIETTFSTESKKVTYFSTGIHYEGTWEIAPKVLLEEGLQLNLTVLNADDPDTRIYTANIIGTFDLAGVKIPIILGTSIGGTSIWTFGLQPEQKIILPSLSDLLSLADADGLFPEGLKNIPKIDINTLEVNFNSTNKQLTLLAFDVATDSSWVIMPDYFEITELSVSFHISNLTDSENREVLGTLYGLFKIGEIYLFCSLSKTEENPNWTIQAGLPKDKKLDIISVAKSLFSNQITLPEDLPVIDFTTLLLTVVPEKKTLKFEAGSSNSWEIIPEKLSINTFHLEFTNDPEQTPNIQGDITTELLVGDVTINLGASLNSGGKSGWKFEGATKPDDVINIDGFVDYIVSKFSVPEPPSWIRNIELKNISVTLDTGSKEFNFGITATTTISDKPAELKINFALKKVKDQYELELSGTLKISDNTFTLDFKVSGTNTSLAATWKNDQEQGGLNLSEISRIFGTEDLTNLLEEIPSQMDLSLIICSVTYNFTDSELVLAAVSRNYGNMVFTAAKIKGNWVYSFQLSIKKIELKNLPLIGEEINNLGEFTVDDLNIFVSSGIIPEVDAKKLNVIIGEAAKKLDLKLPLLPDKPDAIVKGVDLAMKFNAPGISLPFKLNMGKSSSQTKGVLLLADAVKNERATLSKIALLDESEAATSNVKWITIQKSIGPVYMDKIGFSYADGTLNILFSFALKLGALNITLEGLEVGSKLSEFTPSFDLAGLGITFNSGPVQISGGFIKTIVDKVPQYNGQALVKAGTFALSAMGSYAKVNGETSLFVFAMMTNPPLGGPPYFYVTGTAAGFGYNRGLKLPSIDEVPSFPLTSGFVEGQKSPFASADPNAALALLVSKNIVPVKIGQNWLAAGIQFTSFEMLKSYALLVVEFGTSLEIALIGMTTASIPTGAPNPLIYAQLALDVKILPDDGLVSVEAKLTSSSYILDKACHLTGGFAMYIWFGNNEFAGDFVVTLGGYHPNFNVPDHYPKVPQLGFNWVVTSELTIKGGMYFALTPTCLMAGGSLAATWQSGDLKAWFLIGADFLISWKPYHYEAHLYLTFGVSYTFNIDLLFTTISKTISVSLGADLSIWGPSFSGRATIHLWIISFSIDFGDAPSTPPKPISWQDFEKSFLPSANPPEERATNTSIFASKKRKSKLFAASDDSNSNVASSSVKSGLITSYAKGQFNPFQLDWIVESHGTVIETSGLVPSKKWKIVILGRDKKPVDPKQIVITNPDVLAGININFGVAPVEVASDDLNSVHQIEINYFDSNFDEHQIFYFTAVVQNSAKALWDLNNKDISNKNTLIKNVLTGFRFTTGETKPSETPFIKLAYLDGKEYTYTPTLKWSSPKLISGPLPPADPFDVLQKSIIDAPARSSILQALNDNDFDIELNVDVKEMSEKASQFLLSPPQFSYTYWKKV